MTDVVLERADLWTALVPIRLPVKEASFTGNHSVGAAGRMHVLPTGRLPANPGELIGTQALGRVLDQLRADHDYVLLDAAPLLSVGDSMTLSARADAILVVTRLGIVNRTMLVDLARELAGSPASKLGFVVTGVDVKAGYGYGYVYGRGYEPARTSDERLGEIVPPRAARRARATGRGRQLARARMALVDAVTGTSASSRAAVRRSLDAAPACLVAGGVTIGLVSAQGGYFPTSWAWTSTTLLLAVAVWAVVGGRTEAGRLDVLFMAFLAGLAAWIGASIAWSVAPALSVLELQRALVLVGGVGALIVLARRSHVGWLVGTLTFAVFLVAAYGLATRLFPDRLGSYDPIAVYRLSEPVGYWNGLGIFSAMGLLLAVGIVADGRYLVARCLAAASTVVLATTLYFTYSRGAWLALAAGLVAAVLLSARRPALVAAAFACGVPAAIGVFIASQVSGADEPRRGSGPCGG